MITQISDRERQLETEVMHLGELLKAANTERDSLKEDLHDERNRGLRLLEDAKEVQAERDEVIDQNIKLRGTIMQLRTAAKQGLDALTKTVWSDGKERWIVSEKELNIAITALRGVLNKGEKE